MDRKDLNWMVGGPQGSGVDSAAQLFAMSVARSGLHVVGQREYYSNIMGKHSYYKIRAAQGRIRSPSADVHLLSAYDEETLARHLHSKVVVPGGAILYAKGHEQADIHKLPNLDQRVKDEIAKELDTAGKDHTVGSLLELEEGRGVHVQALPYDDFIDEVAKETGRDRNELLILKNTLAVGASLGLLRLAAEHVEDGIRHVFRGKPEKVHDMNIRAARIAAEYAVENLPAYEHRFAVGKAAKDRLWMQGTQAVALAKMAAGCRFHTYYPISPSTDEATYLESNPESNVVVVQTEDEIAAVTMALGAGLTGARASTSTSGPGFSLMIEGLGWGAMCEAPIVVFDYQRGGPSTGLPTRTEQGDLRFALGYGHSDAPRLVLCPGDIEELFYDSIMAFDWAERYQTPVIVLPDKAMAGNAATVPPFDLDGVRIHRGKLADRAWLDEHADEAGRFPRFDTSHEDGVSPRSVLGQQNGIHWLTGDEHTTMGHITEDPVIRDMMMAKRLRKLELAAKEIPSEVKAQFHGPPEADLTIVAYGGTKGAILEAMEELEDDGITVNFLQMRVMSPFPDEVDGILRGAKKVVCLEENATGQLRDLIAARTGFIVPHLATKTNGRPTLPHEVKDVVHHVLDDDAKEVVMRYGV